MFDGDDKYNMIDILFDKIAKDGISHHLSPGCNFSFPWKEVFHNFVKLQPIPKLLVVCWQKPEQGLLKLNTYGSFNISNGKAGLGGALRDEEGKLIMAFSVPIECSGHN
ncbi:hypothetical protein MTR67_013597 [Solanum verrucosum]|uniref:RNase H type-1 domain-containing protein n=1 Tax=Solanum verrucosum TaxID=315347 RepID=A0AAF0TH17_SOLVR|nr:hypothetical protein MTR67_013597 [Solanum verrucosum]